MPHVFYNYGRCSMLKQVGAIPLLREVTSFYAAVNQRVSGVRDSLNPTRNSKTV